MPAEHDLAGLAERLNARLAEVLSDRRLVTDVLGEDLGIKDVDVRSSAPRAEIAVHLRTMDAFDLGKTVDGRDPLVGARRRMTPELRRDLAAVEGPLFAWLAEGDDRPARYAENPAQVIRSLSQVEPRAATRVLGVLPRNAAPLSRLPGIVVDKIDVDTVVAPNPAPPPFDPVMKGTTAADAVFELGLDQLARVLDAEMVPAIRQRASRLAFDTTIPVGAGSQTQQGVLSLLLEDAGDPRLSLDPSAPNTLDVTIGFPESVLELGAGPLLNPVPRSLGAVEVHARLQLSGQPRADGGGTTIALGLVAGSLTVVQPAGVGSIPLPTGVAPAIRQQLWDAAAAVIAQQLAPYYTFLAPLTFDQDLCGIGARGVTPAFRNGSATTVPSLALFISLLASTPTPTPTDTGPSLVPTGADGNLLLSNGLVLDLACCLLSQSEVWGGLPAEPTERSETDMCCRWRDISGVTVGGESFDTLELLEICVDNGLRMKIVLRKEGWGWDARVEVNATVNLAVSDGVLAVDTDTTVKIETNVAWWLTLVSVLAILGGIVLIVIGIFGKNPAAIVAGGALVVLGLGLWTLAHLLPPDIRVPTDFDDAILDLLPGGVREKFGVLSFLTDATWDDVALSGYMTVPNEPPLVAGGEVKLAPGQGLDLDTGEVVNAGDVTHRLDVDLVLHAGLREVGMTTGTSMLARGTRLTSARIVRPPGIDVGIRRTLAAFGSSRLVALTGRPYQSVGESDLRGLVFPATPTYVSVPGSGSSPDGPGATVLAARSSAGRLAKVVVWTDATNVTWLRYRTYDTQLLATIATNHSMQTFGKYPDTDMVTILNARFEAVPAGAWAGRSLTYDWYWQGTKVTGVATIDGDARMTVVDNRCTIDTQQGVDLRGAVCVVVSDGSGLAVTACSNVMHIGRIRKPPGGQPGDPGTPGGPGGPGVPGGPGLPGGPPHL